MHWPGAMAPQLQLLLCKVDMLQPGVLLRWAASMPVSHPDAGTAFAVASQACGRGFKACQHWVCEPAAVGPCSLDQQTISRPQASPWECQLLQLRLTSSYTAVSTWDSSCTSVGNCALSPLGSCLHRCCLWPPGCAQLGNSSCNSSRGQDVARLLQQLQQQQDIMWHPLATAVPQEPAAPEESATPTVVAATAAGGMA
jgi:hypothetical protein